MGGTWVCFGGGDWNGRRKGGMADVATCIGNKTGLRLPRSFSHSLVVEYSWICSQGK